MNGSGIIGAAKLEGTGGLGVENRIDIGTTAGPYLYMASDRINANTSTGVPTGLFLNASGGNIGIGTTGPAAVLHVVGNATATNSVLRLTSMANKTMLNVDTLSGYPYLDMYATDGTTSKVHVDTNSATYFTGGNVGIGSTAPTQALDVGGKVASTNLRQMVSATNEVTTTSTTAVDIPSMSMTINGSGLPVTMIANLSGIYFAATSYALYISLVVDGSQASLCVISAAAAGNKNSCSLTAMQTLSAGSHTVKLQWYLQSAGTAGVSWGLANRSILVFE